MNSILDWHLLSIPNVNIDLFKEAGLFLFDLMKKTRIILCEFMSASIKIIFNVIHTKHVSSLIHFKVRKDHLIFCPTDSSSQHRLHRKNDIEFGPQWVFGHQM